MAGVTAEVLLAGFIVLCANVPADYDTSAGHTLGSLGIFRSRWPYPALALGPAEVGRLAGLLIVSLWAVYLGAWAVVRRSQLAANRRATAFTIAAFALLHTATLTVLMPPVLSADIYHYVLFGRMVAFYDLNPYVVPGTAIIGDEIWPFAFWRDVTTHYGPLWTLISSAAAALGGQDVLLTVVVFKAVAALFNLANCLFVFLLARRLGGDGVAALLLYAWNPLILIETAGSGHNDAVMMTFALLGLLLASRGRLLIGFAALVLSVMVKYLSALLVLFFVVHCLTRAATWRQAAGLAARMAAVGALLTGGLFLPFWAGPEGLERLHSVGAPFKTLVRATLREWLAGVLANGGSLDAAAETYVGVGLHLGFGVFVLLLARASLSRRAGWVRVLELWGVASLAYMVLVYGWNFPWFLVPTLATASVVTQAPLSLRLLAISHGAGILLMLFFYAGLIAASGSGTF